MTHSRRQSGQVVGVDGCPAGWVAVEVDGRAWAARVFGRLRELLAAYPDAVAIGVDMPIGLTADGVRACDGLARARLGARRSSVFPAPSRRLLGLIDGLGYRDANRLSRERLGRGIGAQAFNIFGKVREVDELMTPEVQLRVREVHPELCFTAMRGGQPCGFSKRTQEGSAERVAALRSHLDDLLRPPRGAKLDDLVDAMAAAWTAARIARGEAVTIPEKPELDQRGLRIEMVF